VSAELLDRTVTSIFSAGNYESVKFSLTPGKEDNGRVFNLQLEEKAVNPHLLRFGMYYEGRQGAAADKMVMLLNLTFNDLTGRNSWWSTDLEFVNVNKLRTQYFQPLFKAVFALPMLYDEDDFQVVYKDQDADGRYDIDQTGGTFTLGALFPRIGVLTVGYTFEEVKTNLIVEELPAEDFPETEDTVSSIQVQNRIDRLDDFPFAHSGGYLELDYEWADRQLGGQVDFHKLSAQYWRYFPLAAKHTLGANLRLGSDFRSELPSYREFLLGGRYSFIGYKAEEVRGKSIATLGLEYRYKFFELPAPIGKGIYATLLGNIGNAWRSLDDLVAEIENSEYNPRYGGSIGLAMSTFLGPVTVDFALGDEGRRVFYFNIGTLF
jgi:outer membrane protein assembly factor BamA